MVEVRTPHRHKHTHTHNLSPNLLQISAQPQLLSAHDVNEEEG